MKPKLKNHPIRKKVLKPEFRPAYFHVMVKTKDANYNARIDQIYYTAGTAHIYCTI